MILPTIDGELYSEAGFVWTDPTEKYPLGRWVAPPGAKDPGIAAVGAPAYCEHPTTEVLTVSYDLIDGRGIRRWRPGQPLPWDLMNHLSDPDAPIEAHNAMFERLWIEMLAGPKYGWAVPAPHKWRCSMATALVAQRPAALGALAEVLGIADQKDKEGSRLIKKFCIPQQPIPGLIDKKTGRVKRPDQPARRIYPHDDPEDFEKLCLYCDRDVLAEMGAMAKLPPLEGHEISAWQATSEMNRRGLAVDRPGLEACIDTLGQVLDRYGRECEETTGFKATQLEKLKGWLAAYGVHTSSLDAESLEALLAQPGIHPTARRVLELRALTGSASVKKTFAIRNRLSSDDRLRDIMVHHGTRPGRPTGEGPQPLNLPKAGPKLSWCDCGRPAKHAPNCPWCGGLKRADARTSWDSAMVDHVIEIMSTGSLDMVEGFFGDAMTAIQGCVRGLFVAGPGHDLVSTDYSSLQAVVAACLAGEQWRIDAFRRGDPIYLLGASKITGKPLQFYLDWHDEHGDHHVDRQKIGKVSELACLSGQTLVWVRGVNKNGKRGHPRWLRLDRVTTNHRVFDGKRFVRHDGLIHRGRKPVELRAGIIATPDHEFFVGKRKVRFDQMRAEDWREAVDPLTALFTPSMVMPENSPTFAETYDLLNCGPNHRFLIASIEGPVLASNCGFQGWINSYRAFGSEEPDEVIRQQILAWRAASPAIVEAWGGQWRGPPWRREKHELYGLEGMFIAAVQKPGEYFEYRGIGFCMEEPDCLVIRLPQIDGIRRALRYHEPMLTPSARNPDEWAISYATWNTNPNYGARGWVRMPTWGGRLFENCLAEGTDVLTGRGWVPIEQIRADDLVHDGLELVSHRGVLYKGRQVCMSLDGVQITPDHKVLDHAQNWRAASSVQKLFRPKIRDAYGFGRCSKNARAASHAMGFFVRLRECLRKSRAGRNQVDAQRRDPELRVFGRSVHRREKYQARYERASRVCGLSIDARSMSVADASGVAQLRGARHSCLRALVDEFRCFLVRYGSDLLAGFGSRQTRQRWAVFARRLPMDDTSGQFEQPASNDYLGNRMGSDAIGRRMSPGRAGETRCVLAASSGLADGSPLVARRVYDVVNCGPRRRFVVRGASGPFIVHNCVMGVEVDIQRFGARLLAKHGYPMVLGVYDEDVCEIPHGKPLTLGLPPVDGLDPYVQEVEHLLSIMPAEIADWPIKASGGWRGRRYRKA